MRSEANNVVDNTSAAYIYSTASNDVNFVNWKKTSERSVTIPEGNIKIKGGANVPNSNLMTPKGVVTPVTQSQLDFLEKNKLFNSLIDQGFLKITKNKIKISKAVKDMEEKDKCANLRESDYKKPPVLNQFSKKANDGEEFSSSNDFYDREDFV